MSDVYLGSQAPLYQNVSIKVRNKNGKVITERTAKNRITKLMLLGISRFLLGQFNDSSPDKIYEVIPRYLALGTNIPGADANEANVTTTPTVNDSRLLNEIKISSSTGRTEDVKRIWIAERNMCKLNTKFSDPFIKISIKIYVSSNNYDDMSIGEAGLFSKEKDNNCLARVCFTPFIKHKDDVLDIQWDITLLSYGQTIYPDSIQIITGDKITLPITYTTNHYITTNIGLRLGNWGYEDYIVDTNNNRLFFVDDDEIIKIAENKTIEDLKKTEWYDYLTRKGLDSEFYTILNFLLGNKFNSTDPEYYKYVLSVHDNLPTPLHVGNILRNTDFDLDEKSIGYTYLYKDYTDYTYIDTSFIYYIDEQETSPNSYKWVNTNNNKVEYKIKNRRVYRLIGEDNWEAMNYYMYNGIIVDENIHDCGYAYKDGKIYRTSKFTTNEKLLSFLNYSNNVDNLQVIVYNLHLQLPEDINDNTYTISQSEFSIDFDDYNKIYNNNNYSYYHISNDGYWVTGDYFKLIASILPTTVTDKEIKWIIQNPDIATINFDGVVTAWNVGETTAIACTSNDLTAKCIIEVIKNSQYIPIEEIDVEPKEVTLYVDGNINQSQTVIAYTYPMIATNNTVTWTADNTISQCINLINIGNNQVQITLNESGNIGVGYIKATAQSGVYDECLIKVVYLDNGEDCDCPDPSHKVQQI